MGSKIEYYRPKYFYGFSVTITLFVKPHQGTGMIWRDLPGIDGETTLVKMVEKIEDEERYAMFNLPINGYIIITVRDETKRSYIQQNYYTATEDGIVLDEEKSENLFTFIPIELINLEKTT